MRPGADTVSGALLYPHLVGPDLGRSKPVNNGAFSDETHITVVKSFIVLAHFDFESYSAIW